HGPGSIHVQNKTRKHEATCKLCHEDEGLEHESAKDQDIIRSVSASVCGQCHNRGSTPGGDPTRGEEFSFPADFKLGDDIRSTSFNPSTPENDENGDNWWGNGLSKNRHQEFSDWSKSGHSRALSNLLASHAEKGSKHGPVTDKCLHCHSTDYRHTIEGDKPTLSSARFGITCVACHEPHGHDKKKPGFGDGSSTCGECHVMSMASGDKKHIPCPDERVTCADCHMPRIAITGGFFSLRSHSFNIIKPMSSIENDMPNSCQNSGCHDDRNLQWAIDAYKKFYGEDDIARQ
ncbi:MAG: cytochrome C, partial [Gammaproteobacteria bacterium]|nr:cytochrome C [Gammaproteobacteria bacterium]